MKQPFLNTLNEQGRPMYNVRFADTEALALQMKHHYGETLSMEMLKQEIELAADAMSSAARHGSFRDVTTIAENGNKLLTIQRWVQAVTK